MRLRIPPGRSGRLWLRDRLQAATKAADLLDHKRRELEVELRHVQGIGSVREKGWHEAAEEARTWLARVDATGGQRSIALVAGLTSEGARVQVEWRHVMGVHFPVDHVVTFSTRPPIAALEGGAALIGAQAAYQRAVEAAIAHAVAGAALRRIRTDIQRTVARLRALELRAIPAHRQALAALELALDEKDREEAIAARWAVQEKQIGAGSPADAP